MTISVSFDENPIGRSIAHLDLLLRTGVNGGGTVSSDENWPSWVPDWTARALDTIPPGNGFSAASFSPSHSALHGPNELEVAGIHLDTITYVYRLEIKSFPDLADYLNQLGLEKIMEKRYRTGESFLDAHLHVITHSRFRERIPHVGRPEFGHVREHKINLAQGRGTLYDLTQYGNDMMVGLEDSYCFLTSDGYLGHCRTRGTVEKGDQVFIPLGCQVSILVRPTFNNKHRSLGDCFVHGVMHGETLLGSLPPDYSVQEINRSDGITRTHFLNHDTGEHKGYLFSTWGMEVDDPIYCPLFVHETGKVVPHDPRLEMCALIERGVNVQTVTLV